MNKINNIYHLLKDKPEIEVPAEIPIITKDLKTLFHKSVVGIFFYGSCLHSKKLKDKVIDFYIIVDDYRNAYNNKFLTISNKLCPPNVFYHEMEIGGLLMRSKYAIISQKDFIKRCGSSMLNSSIWARFCQPSALIYVQDDNVRKSLNMAVSSAVATAIHSVLPLFSYVPTSMELWSEIFRRTYSVEFRAEREQKSLEIYVNDQDHYDALTALVYQAEGIDPNLTIYKQPPRMPIIMAYIHWWLRRINGKVVSILRLIKAAITFEGGIDYVAWKIKRHSGVELDVKPWMRKYPIIAGLVCFWRMKKLDAFR